MPPIEFALLRSCDLTQNYRICYFRIFCLPASLLKYRFFKKCMLKTKQTRVHARKRSGSVRMPIFKFLCHLIIYYDSLLSLAPDEQLGSVSQHCMLSLIVCLFPALFSGPTRAEKPGGCACCGRCVPANQLYPVGLWENRYCFHSRKEKEEEKESEAR